jgi:hypothetical protein
VSQSGVKKLLNPRTKKNNPQSLPADDLDEPTIPSELMRNLNGVPVYHPRHRYAADDRLCLSTPSFGILLAITVILFITSVVASSMLCYRSR